MSGKKRNTVLTLMCITSWDTGISNLRNVYQLASVVKIQWLKIMLASDRGLGEHL